MFKTWICVVVLDLVVLAYSVPGRFYHDYHTSHDKNPWSGEWSHSWQHEWFGQTTPWPARRRTTTPRIVTTSTPSTTPLQPVIRDVEIRFGETTTSVYSPTPKPITLIQEEIPLVNEDKPPQTEADSGPKQNVAALQGVPIGTLGEAGNSEIEPVKDEVIYLSQNEDKRSEAEASAASENLNTFGIAVVNYHDVEPADDSETKLEQETFTNNEDQSQASIPKETGNLPITAISTIDATDNTEAKPDKTETSNKPVSEGDSYLASLNHALEGIRGTEDGKTEYKKPFLDEKTSMWHVAIYEKKKDQYEHICGGSLIRADIVISAGHCFWSPVLDALPKTNFRVAAGKLYPRYDDPRDTAAQYSDIRDISISNMVAPCLQPDLAYVTLVTRFMYTSAVRPVCFSLESGLERRQLKEENTGTVASWSTFENGECKPAGHRWETLPFVKKRVCQYDANYNTVGSARICAGHANDTTVCPSDSGNGLVFYQDKIPYLRGVTTNLPVHRICANFYTRSFTNIIDTSELLKSYFKGITDVYDLGECESLYGNRTDQRNETSLDRDVFEDKIPVIPPERKPDGDNDNAFITQEIGAESVPTLSDTSAPLYQWHVGVYSKRWTPYMQICGGTLVKRDFVISAAHCFWDDATGKQPASDFAVAGGKLYRPWNDTRDTYGQHSDVSEITLPPRFRGAATSFQDDIAVLRLSAPFTYAPGVQAVCLNFSRAFQMDNLWPGSRGPILGWGLTEENGHPSQRLTYLWLPYVDVEMCFNQSEPSFLKYITSDKICAGDTTTGKALCRGDSGGGYVQYSDEIPYLYGIASTAAGNENLCNAFALAALTSVHSHSAFLLENIPGIERECGKTETERVQTGGIGTDGAGTGSLIGTDGVETGSLIGTNGAETGSLIGTNGAGTGSLIGTDGVGTGSLIGTNGIGIGSLIGTNGVRPGNIGTDGGTSMAGLGTNGGNVGGSGIRVGTEPPVYTNLPYFPYPNHFVCNCNCKP